MIISNIKYQLSSITDSAYLGFVNAQFGDDGFRPAKDTRYTEGAETSPLKNLVIFLSNLIGLLTILGGLFFIVYFFMGAFKWVTAQGDSGKVEKARNQIIQGVLGLVVIVMSYGLIGIAGTILGIDLINLEESIKIIVPTSLNSQE